MKLEEHSLGTEENYFIRESPSSARLDRGEDMNSLLMDTDQEEIEYKKRFNGKYDAHCCCSCCGSCAQHLSPMISFALTPTWKLVDNQGSMARDLLAAERTYLAWVRTGLSIIGIGVAIVKLISDRHHEALVKATGGVMIVSGVLAVLYAWFRNIVTMYQLEIGKFSLDTIGPHLFLATTITAGILAMMLMFF
jgi:putative membrane protein